MGSTPPVADADLSRSSLLLRLAVDAASGAKRRRCSTWKAKCFAYADAYSNTGHLVPFGLAPVGARPNKFFRKTFFTWSHRKVIMAVTEGLADGGSIDSFVWGHAVSHQRS